MNTKKHSMAIKETPVSAQPSKNRPVVQTMHPLDAIHAIQRIIGNQALLKLVVPRRIQTQKAGDLPAATVNTARKTPEIQRYQLEGPWNKNNPVHEVLTLLTLKKALESMPEDQKNPVHNLLSASLRKKLPDLNSNNAHNLDTTTLDPAVHQFIRGVIWPDDPQNYLFDDPNELDFSSGLMWFEEFDEDEKDEAEDLTARSHYGDLSFFHGMAETDQKPEVTRKNLLNWAKFLAATATGRISPNEKIQSIDLIKKFFTDDHFKEWTVRRLLGGEDSKEVKDASIRQRASAALLHFIQDTHTQSHTQRNSKGEITRFYSYAGQDEDKHDEKDVFGPGKTLSERITNTPGAGPAIELGAKLLLMLDKAQNPEDMAEINRFLEDEVFKLAPDAKPAGPGEYAEEE